MALVTCQNVSLSYENNTVLSELSFAVNSGDYFCIVGENGSGKSTLIKSQGYLLTTTLILKKDWIIHQLCFWSNFVQLIK